MKGRLKLDIEIVQLPIPKHLEEFFSPLGSLNTEKKVKGYLTCKCDKEHKFMVKNLEVDSESQRIIISAVCLYCKKEILVFDSYKHGWDGFVCGSDKEAPNNFADLKPVYCKKCKATNHLMAISIFSQGKDDFIEETNGKFDVSLWVNAFEWIIIDLLCNECGYKMNSWLDLETM